MCCLTAFAKLIKEKIAINTNFYTLISLSARSRAFTYQFQPAFCEVNRYNDCIVSSRENKMNTSTFEVQSTETMDLPPGWQLVR